MSAYDKSDQVGYDETDKELNEELQRVYSSIPASERQHMMHRLHDGILQRMKEESTRRCFTFVKKYEECVNTDPPFNMKQCLPHRDALNDCVQEINREEVYQKYRLMFLRGELLKYHERRMASKMEAFKVRAPSSLPEWKSDYAPKYADLMQDLGTLPLGNAREADNDFDTEFEQLSLSKDVRKHIKSNDGADNNSHQDYNVLGINRVLTSNNRSRLSLLFPFIAK